MTYFEERIFGTLGVTPEQINVNLFVSDNGERRDVPIFSADREDNLRILIYDIRRNIVTYDEDGWDTKNVARFSDSYGEKTYYVKRLNPKNIKGDMPKYLGPKGQDTKPFFPPLILDAYENGTPIETLYITEGQIKAFYAGLHGFPIVGFQGVQNLADRRTKAIYHDIELLIQKCQVKNVVFIYDADCRDISKKAIYDKETSDADDKEVTARPFGFYSSICNLKTLLSGFKVNVWFAAINRADNNGPKGLDDLLLANKGHEAEVKEDIDRLGSVGLSGEGRYFFRADVTTQAVKLRKWFHLDSVESFYDFHKSELYKHFFIYVGTTYFGSDNAEKRISAEIKQYIRVGTEYYKLIKKPTIESNFEDSEETRVKWKVGTIRQDHGPKSIKDIKCYDAFINAPNHINYQRVIKNCYNLYEPVFWEPELGAWPTIHSLLSHIFGEQYEIGLDYIQLLYMQPKQMLPILCLVSNERATGKTTFCDFLKEIFRGNCVQVGNDNLLSQFNSYTAGRLLVCCEETNLGDNAAVTEKIKMISTAKKLAMEGKGADAVEVDNFTKFVMCSNNEKFFIKADTEEVRFWIRKVSPIEKENLDPDLIFKIHNEVKYFLGYLLNRKMHYERKTRAYFDFEILKTDAQREFLEAQKPNVIKEITAYLKELFIDSGEDVLYFRPMDFRDNMGKSALMTKTDLQITNLIKQYLTEEQAHGKNGGTFYFRIPVCSAERVGRTVEQRKVYIERYGHPFIFKREDFVKETPEETPGETIK